MAESRQQKHAKLRKKLGLVMLGSLWVDPEDKETVRDLVDHLNYVRHGLTKQRKNDGKNKLSIQNTTEFDMQIEGVYDKTNEMIVSGKKTLKPGKTIIFNGE